MEKRKMLKDVLVNLPIENTTRDAVTEFSVSLAGQFGAHLTAMAYDIKPPLQPSILGVLPNDIVLNARAEMKRLAEAAKERFDQAVKRSGVSGESHVTSAYLPEAAQLIGSRARRFDLSLIQQAKEKVLSAENMLIEAALFDSGRPVIIVPYIHQGPGKLDRITVCWDGSRAAARALGDAMPLLRRAKSVDVVVVTTEAPKSDEISGADIAQHLARHQLEVTLRQIS